MKELRSIGIQPDILVCRTENDLSEDLKAKLALFCDVDREAVVQLKDAVSIYEVPLMLAQERLDKEGELTGALETRDARIQELEAGNESMTARITDLENLLQEKAGLEDQLRDLRAENESREQALESLRGELAEAREQAARAEELEGVVVERDALPVAFGPVTARELRWPWRTSSDHRTFSDIKADTSPAKPGDLPW